MLDKFKLKFGIRLTRNPLTANLVEEVGNNSIDEFVSIAHDHSKDAIAYGTTAEKLINHCIRNIGYIKTQIEYDKKYPACENEWLIRELMDKEDPKKLVIKLKILLEYEDDNILNIIESHE